MRFLTREQLQGLADVEPAGQEMIEDQAAEIGGDDVDEVDVPLRQAIRGYLVDCLLDIDADDEWWGDIGEMTSCFADGWLGCIEFAERETT